MRIEPQLRADLDAVLRDGETLSEFVESTVRGAVEHRLVQSAFAARADEAWYASGQVVLPPLFQGGQR